MKIIALLLAFTFFGMAFVSNAYAQGDAAEGESIANKICTRCHNVKASGPFKQYPPSFAAIAVFRSADQIYERIVLPPLHSSMPQIGTMLMPENIDHLVAYITSLEGP